MAGLGRWSPPLNVVVVEDEPDIATLTAMHLEQVGHIVVGVFHNVNGPKTVVNWKYVDVAFIDFALPGENGGELILWLKEHYPDVTRVMASAYWNQNDMLAFESGELTEAAGVIRTEVLEAVDFFLQKPYSTSEMGDLLQRIKDRKSNHDIWHDPEAERRYIEGLGK